MRWSLEEAFEYGVVFGIRDPETEKLEGVCAAYPPGGVYEWGTIGVFCNIEVGEKIRNTT